MAEFNEESLHISTNEPLISDLGHVIYIMTVLKSDQAMTSSNKKRPRVDEDKGVKTLKRDHWIGTYKSQFDFDSNRPKWLVFLLFACEDEDEQNEIDFSCQFLVVKNRLIWMNRENQSLWSLDVFRDEPSDPL